MANGRDFDSTERMEVIQATFDRLIQGNPMGRACKDALRLDPAARYVAIDAHLSIPRKNIFAEWDAEAAGKLLTMR